MGASVLQISGGLIQAGSQISGGKAAERAAKLNAKLILEQQFEQEKILREEGKRVRGRNRARIAKSGVRAEGSPVDFMALNELDLQRQIHRQRRAAMVEATQQREAGRGARRAGQLGAFASILDTSGRALLARDNPLAAALASRS